MRRRWHYWISLVAFAWATTVLADETKNLLTVPCAQMLPNNPACQPSAKDQKKAAAAFSRAMKLQRSRRFDEAYQQFDTAARLLPTNVDYVTALAMVRQQLVLQHIQRGNADLESGKQVEAQAEFRSAVNLDPDNKFAARRLSESVDRLGLQANGAPRVVEDAGELRAVPSTGKHDFHFRGDSRELLTQVAQAFGLTAEFDDSVLSRRVHFDIDDVDFYVAMRAAGAVTATFWTPLSEKQILIAKDSTENHRLFDRMAMRSFYIPAITQAKELYDFVNVLRTIFEIRFIQPDMQSGIIVVRAPVDVLDAATQTLESLGDAHPEVMLELTLYEIDHQLTRNLGISIPNQFTLFNIPQAAIAGLLASLGGQNVQNLINQLIASGGINQANSQAISGLLAQLQGQQGQNSLFSQPVATFGNGLTLMGLTLGQLSGQLSLNESWVRTLEHATLRASQNNDTTFRLGSRYPILNASYAPVFNTSAIAQVLGNNSYRAPFPSFTYEDLGLSVKVKPAIHSNLDVGLELTVQLRTLAGQNINGVPVIANREYKGSINLMNGEQAVVAGEIDNNEQLSLSGIPGLGAVPGINKIMTTNQKTLRSNELMMVITPHVINAAEKSHQTEAWLPK